MVSFCNWIMWLLRCTDDKIRNYSFNVCFITKILCKFYMEECQIVGSLWLLSSSSKKIRSGFTTLSFWSHAGNTSFLSKFSWVFFKDLVKNNATKNWSISPTAAEKTKNFPLTESLFWTKWLRGANLWVAWIKGKIPNRSQW